MDLQRIQIKAFVQGRTELDIDALTKQWHLWIRDALIPSEQLIDVADYSHVHEGPALLLVAHGANYSLDREHGKSGLLYARKRGLSGSLAQRFETCAERLREAVDLTETDGAGLKFSRTQFEIRIQDRLLVPNTDEGLSLIQTAAVTALEKTFGTRVTATRVSTDSREPLTLSLC